MTNQQYLQELLPKLGEQIPFEWRVQSHNREKTKAQCTAYIDARDAMNLLDKHCLYGWQSKFEQVGEFIFCSIGVIMPDGSTIWRTDAGARPEANQQDQMYEQAGKSAASDALKRAAVQWNVFRWGYDLERIWLPSNGRQVVDDKGNVVWDLTGHINKLRGAKTASAPAPEPAAPQPAAATKPQLDDPKFQAMLQYLDEGKIKEVEAAMKKYSLNLSQKAVLTARINQVRAAATKTAAKKA